jgi:hypothetical protein
MLVLAMQFSRGEGPVEHVGSGAGGADKRQPKGERATDPAKTGSGALPQNGREVVSQIHVNLER